MKTVGQIGQFVRGCNKMRTDLTLSPKQLTLTEVQERLPELRDLLQQHNAQAAYLFGSVLNNGHSHQSDLDIAVLSPPDLADWFTYYNDLHADLCRFFQADNVVLVLLDQARRIRGNAKAPVSVPRLS